MKSIQSRLLLMLLLFIIVPYFMSVLLIYTQTKTNVEQQELEDSKEQMSQASEDLEAYIDDLVNLPYILYRNPDLFKIFEQGFDRSLYLNQMEIYKGMITFFLMRDEIKQVRFYIEEGHSAFTVYNAMISARKLQPDLLQQEPIRRLMDADANYLIEAPHRIENYNNVPYMPQSDQTMVLTIHHKIVDALSGKFLGIITFDVDLDKVARISNHLMTSGHESVWLADADGQIVYASDAAMIGEPIPSELRQHIGGSSSGGMMSNGQIVMANTLTAPVTQWHFVKETSNRFLFQDARETALTNIIVGVIVGALGIVMVFVISYKITSPIKRLSGKVRSVEGKNLDASFDDRREDEIGLLERHIKDMMSRINSYIDREYRLEIENRKNRDRALQSQINPHFLFNALQSIGTLAVLSEAPKVYELITSLSKMMRYAIRADQVVTVRKELDYVRAYLNLQEERFPGGFQYSIEVPDDLLDIPVPVMILQPLAENFFKHCYEEEGEGTFLRIYGSKQDGLLHLVVDSTGRSLPEDRMEALRRNIRAPLTDGDKANEHIGLKNIHDRLVLMYGNAAGVVLDSIREQGFSVKLLIPVNLKEDEENESSNRG